jgi:chromosome partition protein MukF
VAGIERRQRGLDRQQEAVQEQIGALLQADWFGAVDQCQSLLDETSHTLAELNTVLLRDTNQIMAVLADVEQLAAAAGMSEAEDAIRRVCEQADRVAAWGGARQRAWSDYYQYVHRFLRDVVRLDPDRAISERLRNQLAIWQFQQFFLVVARTPSMLLLRESNSRGSRPPVTRPRRDREAIVEEVLPELDLATLRDRVRAALGNGHTTLTEILNDVLPEVAAPNRYLSIGRVALQVANESGAQSPHERDWVPIVENLIVEDWLLRKER